MLKKILSFMAQQSQLALQQKTSFRASWYNEWAKVILKAYEPGQKVVATSQYAFPMEILAAFDVAPFDYEIAGALLTATEFGVPTMNEAEIRGYSLDTCSFHRATVGGFYQGYYPKPEVIITTSYYCDGKVKTNDILASLYKKQPLLLYVPSTVSKESIAYVEAQLRQIAAVIGQVTGQTLDEDRLREAVRSSNRARALRLKILELLRHSPTPWNGQDMIGYSIHGNLFSGTPTMERLNQTVIDELSSRITSSTLRPEKHRVYWFAWLPTYPSNLFSTLREHQVSVALCETARVYDEAIDEDHPFTGLALKCLFNPFVGSSLRRIEGLDTLKDSYRLDGAILFATPACRQSNAAWKILKDTAEKLDLPFLMVDMDIGDPRGHSHEQVRTRLESFIELMERGG